jgi:predicted DNA-binding transcriptional regulator AlpA
MASKKGADGMKRWLSYRGVSEMTSLSESTIRRLIAEGKLSAPVEITTGRKVFDGDTVEGEMEALIAERRSPEAAA